MSRPKLPIGSVGKITYEQVGDHVHASAYTRTASGARRLVKATADNREQAAVEPRVKAAEKGVLGSGPSSVLTLGLMIDKWVAEVVEPRNVREQSKRVYRTKAKRLKGLYGGIELNDLRGERMQIIVNDLALKFSSGEYRALRGVLTRTLNYAVMIESSKLWVGRSLRPPLALLEHPGTVTAHAGERRDVLLGHLELGPTASKLSPELSRYLQRGPAYIQLPTTHMSSVPSSLTGKGRSSQPHETGKGSRAHATTEPDAPAGVAAVPHAAYPHARGRPGVRRVAHSLT